MKPSRLWASAAPLLAAFLLLAPPLLRGDDWPMFGHNGSRNAVSSEKKVPGDDRGRDGVRCR